MVVTKMSVWVRLPNLPLYFCHKAVLTDIDIRNFEIGLYPPLKALAFDGCAHCGITIFAPTGYGTRHMPFWEMVFYCS